MRLTSAAALSLVLASVTTAVTVPALAHISLDAPKGRYWQTTGMQTDQNKLKTSPCGSGADSRTKDATLITTYKPGEKITLKFRETIQHPGHFEVSFDSEGQDFPFPGEAPSATSGVTVLVPSIADKTTADYSVEVTLPNVECEKCTLQLVQVMTTKAPPYAKTGDLYFQCADITLKGGGGGGTGGSSAGGASATGGTSAGGVAGAPSGNGGKTSGGVSAGGSATGGSLATTGGFGTTGGSSATGGTTSTSTGGNGTGGSGNSTGGTPGSASTGGTTSSTGGTPNSTGTGGATSSTGGTPTSTTGGSSSPATGGSGTPPDVSEEPGCSMTRSHGSPRSGAVLSLFALSALLGWQRRRRVMAPHRLR